MIRVGGMPRLAIGANPASIFNHDFAHGRVWVHARFHRQIKIFSSKEALQFDRFLSRDGAFYRPHTRLHLFHRGIYEWIRIFLARPSWFLFWFRESRKPVRKDKECSENENCAGGYGLFHNMAIPVR